ncbi:MAG: hypothetical protein JOZ54_17100 [Acidobacteria bacterium]|nr:hypothetical protein [Acidobacteriota bacterium]
MRYIALGDSVSIDRYPAAETGIDRLGAASLFYRNNDKVWPEFRDRDLAHIHPGITFTNLTEDGATTTDVIEKQLPRMRGKADIITLTAGGNDLLLSIGSRWSPVPTILGRISEILEALDEGLVIVATVYDPSDGTSVLEGKSLPTEGAWLAEINERIRSLATQRIRIADIHHHFLGHGVTATEDERWYWKESIIEPAARGASEVRKLWLEALQR